VEADLLQIVPPRGKPLLKDGTRTKLQALYDRVPAVSCECDKLGQCCELTEEEIVAEFATMYPLYEVEYYNIVDFVGSHFGADLQEELLSISNERPEGCPFLTDSRGCSIHSVRPMACRTYGVLSREEVEKTASEARETVPKSWINSFLYTERHTVCANARLLEPEKSAAHAQSMISFEYEREMIQLGRESGMLKGVRKQVLQDSSGLVHVTRWTWGGFNALMRSSTDWLKGHFAEYWKQSILGE